MWLTIGIRCISLALKSTHHLTKRFMVSLSTKFIKRLDEMTKKNSWLLFATKKIVESIIWPIIRALDFQAPLIRNAEIRNNNHLRRVLWLEVAAPLFNHVSQDRYLLICSNNFGIEIEITLLFFIFNRSYHFPVPWSLKRSTLNEPKVRSI